MKHAFSLVELAIVLVILGLLAGGVLSGQSLIRAAELRAVSTEYGRYYTAVQSFKDKYFAIPGDMANAQSFWQAAHGTAATCVTTTTGDKRTCNGNGDGVIALSTGSNEQFRFWQHLANAGLVEGSYTGIEGAGGVDAAVIGANVPKSRLNNAGWSVFYAPNDPGSADVFANDYQNYMVFGAAISTSVTANRVISPEETWNVDTKLDDGKPGTGKVIARFIQECTNAANQTDINTTYKLANPSKDCAIIVSRAF